MNCREFWNTMPELAGDRGGARLDHERDCPRCAALLERQRALAEGLRAVAAQGRQVEAPARLEARLVRAFRSHNGVAAGRPQLAWVPALTWMAAAAAVLALALLLVRDRQPQPAGRGIPGRIELAALQLPASAETAGDSLYADGGFIPLPNAARVGATEDVNLVRVELPRSSMIALGYPVSAERASEAVEAEVVLGADGLARAVRFLDD